MPTKDGSKLRDHRLKKLEDRMNKHEEVLFGEHGVLTNHLPHIQQSLTSIETKLLIATIFNVGAILLSATLLKIFS